MQELLSGAAPRKPRPSPRRVTYLPRALDSRPLSVIASEEPNSEASARKAKTPLQECPPRLPGTFPTHATSKATSKTCVSSSGCSVPAGAGAPTAPLALSARPATTHAPDAEDSTYHGTRLPPPRHLTASEPGNGPAKAGSHSLPVCLIRDTHWAEVIPKPAAGSHLGSSASGGSCESVGLSPRHVTHSTPDVRVFCALGDGALGNLYVLPVAPEFLAHRPAPGPCTELQRAGSSDLCPAR